MTDIEPTLVEFLRAQLDDDERDALAVAPPGRPLESGRYLNWIEAGTAVGDISGHVLAYSVHPPPARMHVAKHDPARVLAEMDAKRRIIDMGWSTCGYPYPDRGHYPDDIKSGCDGCHAAHSADRDHLQVLRLLALPYADHPQYRTEWRPT